MILNQHYSIILIKKKRINLIKNIKVLMLVLNQTVLHGKAIKNIILLKSSRIQQIPRSLSRHLYQHHQKVELQQFCHRMLNLIVIIKIFCRLKRNYLKKCRKVQNCFRNQKESIGRKIPLKASNLKNKLIQKLKIVARIFRNIKII